MGYKRLYLVNITLAARRPKIQFCLNPVHCLRRLCRPGLSYFGERARYRCAPPPPPHPPTPWALRAQWGPSGPFSPKCQTRTRPTLAPPTFCFFTALFCFSVSFANFSALPFHCMSVSRAFSFTLCALFVFVCSCSGMLSCFVCRACCLVVCLSRVCCVLLWHRTSLLNLRAHVL